MTTENNLSHRRQQDRPTQLSVDDDDDYNNQMIRLEN